MEVSVMPEPTALLSDITIDRATAEAELEKGLEDTFPASDPIAIVQPVHRVEPRDASPRTGQGERTAGRRPRSPGGGAPNGESRAGVR